MIELQYVEREKTHVLGAGMDSSFVTVGKEKVLQQRTVLNVVEVANELQGPIWSEWVDVPVVNEA